MKDTTSKLKMSTVVGLKKNLVTKLCPDSFNVGSILQKRDCGLVRSLGDATYIIIKKGCYLKTRSGGYSLKAILIQGEGELLINAIRIPVIAPCVLSIPKGTHYRLRSIKKDLYILQENKGLLKINETPLQTKSSLMEQDDFY